MSDPYTYPHSNILKNKFGVKDKNILEQMEVDYTSMRMCELEKKSLAGNYDFFHLCEFHQYIFQDIYSWAGNPREINIEKPERALGGISVEYEDVETIERAANAALREMKAVDFKRQPFDTEVDTFSKAMADLWKVHCFREGNTRTTVTFCLQYLEDQGIHINKSLFKDNVDYVRTALVAASAYFHDIGDKRDRSHLNRILKDALQSVKKEKLVGQKKRISKAPAKQTKKKVKDLER